MKKIALILLTCILVFAFSACRKPSPDSEGVPKSNLVTGEDYFYEEGIYTGYGADGGKAWGKLSNSDGNAVPDAKTAISVATEQLEKEQLVGRYQGLCCQASFMTRRTSFGLSASIKSRWFPEEATMLPFGKKRGRF